MGQVISFVSGKGGTGKTALCAAIATLLAKQKKTVLCIDCDAGLRNLDLFLGMGKEQILSFADICRGDYPLSSAAIHPKYPSLSVLTAPINGSLSQIDLNSFQEMLEQARKQFDFILLDGSAGLELSIASFADRCILVTLPDPAAIRCGERAAQELEKMGCPLVQLVVNRLHNDLLKAMGMNIDDIMDAVGLPLLGIVPSDPNVIFALSKGKPLILYTHNGAVPACKRIAKRLIGLSVPIANR